MRTIRPVPPEPPRRRSPLLAMLLAAVSVAAFLAGRATADHEVPVAAPPAPSRTAPPPPAAATAVPIRVGPAHTVYEQAIDQAARDGLRVWVEADLVKRWFAGRQQFYSGLYSVAALAHRPGVVGVKIADELGYQDGFRDSASILRFLRESAAALHRLAPGRLILVDFVVPELGCLPGKLLKPVWATVCEVNARGRYPQLSLVAMDRYLSSPSIDVADLSTSLLADKSYAGWGVQRDEAQRVAWSEIVRRGWHREVRVQTRKAMATPDGRPADAATVARDMHTWIDLPLHSGAQAVDVWTWRQHYSGTVYGLLAQKAPSNPLWDALRQRRRAGATLFTHFTPTSTNAGVQPDLARVRQGFTDVFMAAGVG